MPEPITSAAGAIPCPFCGVNHTDMSNRYTDHYQVHCMACGADGPSGARLDIAITSWNTRALSEPEQGGGVVAWTVRKVHDDEAPDNSYDVLLPDGTWSGYVAVDATDALESAKADWAKKHPRQPPTASVVEREAVARMFKQHHRDSCYPEAQDHEANAFADAVIAALTARAKPHADEITDAARLDALRDESWDLRCFDIQTGGGDADIGWRVIGHWQAEPHERVLAEVDNDDPRAAIDRAIRARALPIAADAKGERA